MKIRSDFPHRIHYTRHQWITLSDGIRLSASIWRPADTQEPVPAILEYIPYRKRDGTAIRDSIFHPLFAGHGYASVRVDIRGSGDSEGIIEDEYLPQELDDAVEVIHWLAAQDWCSGKVGMMGKSWGGFNALQVAALQPEPLKAIISVCSTDDRYADDVHFKGGCLLTSDMLGWATTMAAWNARPPSPEIAGEQWLDLWRQRCEQTPPFIERWLRHQRRDAFWQHGSVCEDYSAVKAATLLVGGWADPYVNAIPRMMRGLECPKQALIGPWAHEYPQRARPGPQIGFTQECLRWWDYWLKGEDNGVMATAPIRAYISDSIPAAGDYEQRAGRWVATVSLDSADSLVLEPYPLQLSSEQRLLAVPANPDTPTAQADSSNTSELTVSTDLSVGLAGGLFFSMGQAGDYPTEQRQSDACSLCFDSAPLNEPQAILGTPQLTIRLKADQPRALLAARLCAVNPQGQSALVSWGQLNLCHRHSHEHPEALTPGEWLNIDLTLNATGYRLLPGWRWRLALSPAYTAHAWPSPQLATLTIDPAASRLVLPLLAIDDLPEPTFDVAECSTPLPRDTEMPAERSRTLSFEAANEMWQLHDYNDSGLHWLAGETRHGDHSEDRLMVNAGEPLSTRMHCLRIAHTGNREHHCDTEADASMFCDADNFYVHWTVKTRHNGEPVWEKSGSVLVPRDFV